VNSHRVLIGLSALLLTLCSLVVVPPVWDQLHTLYPTPETESAPPKNFDTPQRVIERCQCNLPSLYARPGSDAAGRHVFWRLPLTSPQQANSFQPPLATWPPAPLESSKGLPVRAPSLRSRTQEPALAPPQLDVAPRNQQRRVHEAKYKHAGQIQTLLTGSKRQHVFVVCQPPHPSALDSPFRTMEWHPYAMDLRQRAPAADEADVCSYQTRQTEQVDGKDRNKNGGMPVNPVLEIHLSGKLSRWL
jgi:hypothetical protein